MFNLYRKIKFPNNGWFKFSRNENSDDFLLITPIGELMTPESEIEGLKHALDVGGDSSVNFLPMD